MYLHIALLAAPYTILTYRPHPAFPASFWQKGLRVLIPLGARRELVCGIVLERTEETDLAASKLKAVGWPLETTPLLTEECLTLFCEMAKRQGEAPGKIASGFLPQGLKGPAVLHRISETRSEHIPIAALAKLPLEPSEAFVRELLSGQAKILARIQDGRAEERFLLATDPPWPVRPQAKLQRSILDYLYTHGKTAKKALAQALGKEPHTALKDLLSKGFIRIEREDAALNGESEIASAELLPPMAPPFRLNEAQEKALYDLSAKLEGGFGTALLYGVTGSGKTAVYLELAVKALTGGKSVFLLVPEVALALKILRDTRTLYPDLPVIFYHGYQSQAYRERVWRSMESGKPYFILGTRSALFLPAREIGLIMLDEEHDGSFTQEDGLAYHTKEIAWLRAKKHGALLVLGSATPDIRTFFAAEEGEIPRLTLPGRISGQALPPIRVVDVHERRSLSESVTLLAKESLKCLEETVRRGEQAVILLNRRGFAPHMFCLECGKTEHCPDCAIALTYHKGQGKLVCHYCGYTRPFPSPCSHCGATSFLPLGEGTERVSEEVEAYLGKPVLRLDRDSTRREGRMEAILTSFAHEEAQVLVGTQMLSKGHHFPKVTLVIAADADQGLNIPDYRAAERTFQLLLQTAGRAGRGNLPGTVLLQTRDVSHYVWPYILANDYEGFYADELARRKKHAYPPFAKLALIRFSFAREENKAEEELAMLSLALKAEAPKCGVTLLGPVPSPLSMLRGRKRFQCLIKANDWNVIRTLYHQCLARCRIRFLRTRLDLDPVNML